MAADARRLRVGVLFGGESAEHEVSLQSARNIVQAMDRERYEPVLIGIDRSGRWHLADAARFLRNAADPRRIRLGESERDVTLVPGRPGGDGEGASGLVPLGATDGAARLAEPLDVVFPVLHGPMGEDGSVQGLLRLAHLPFVGAGVLGSAVGMDKDVAKRLLRDAGIPTARFRTFRDGAGPRPDYEELAAELGTPLFVKPANLGSSVGVAKVRTEAELESAVAEAFSYDRKILVEEHVPGREIECAVLGNEEPEASVPGEIVARHEFYSYEAKYLDDAGAELRIPAELPPRLVGRVQEMSVDAFRTLGCEGMARVDFFLAADERLLVNELNTIPGFTRISMYPKLWEASGIGYADLIHRLIQLALQRAERERRLRSSVEL